MNLAIYTNVREWVMAIKGQAEAKHAGAGRGGSGRVGTGRGGAGHCVNRGVRDVIFTLQLQI